MREQAIKEGFTPLRKAATMGAASSAPPAPPSIAELRIGDMADLRGQDLAPLYKFAEDREEIYIQRLREAVAIKGVSAWVDHRPKIVEMLEWAKAWAEKSRAARVLDGSRRRVRRPRRRPESRRPESRRPESRRSESRPRPGVASTPRRRARSKRSGAMGSFLDRDDLVMAS